MRFVTKITLLIFTQHLLSPVWLCKFPTLQFLHIHFGSFYLFFGCVLISFLLNFSFKLFCSWILRWTMLVRIWNQFIVHIIWHTLFAYNNKIFYVSINLRMPNKKPNCRTKNCKIKERQKLMSLFHCCLVQVDGKKATGEKKRITKIKKNKEVNGWLTKACVAVILRVKNATSSSECNKFDDCVCLCSYRVDGMRIFLWYGCEIFCSWFSSISCAYTVRFAPIYNFLID